jgi:hypothetical protein
MTPRRRHRVIVLADRVDRSILKAIHYARNINPTEIRAVHAGADPIRAADLADRWGEFGHVLGVALDVEECADRNVAHTLARYVQSMLDHDSEVTVIIPRREYPRPVERLLHDRTSRSIVQALRSFPHVDLVTVPYRLHRPAKDRPGESELGAPRAAEEVIEGAISEPVPASLPQAAR